MKRYQITELFQIALKEYPQLKELNISIEESSEFSCICEDLEAYKITYTNLENDKEKVFYKNICSYLQNKYKFKDGVKMIMEFENVFSFLHEVGHIINMDSVEDEQVHYSNFKNKEYNSYYQAFKAYREIPTEQKADQTAINLMIKYNKEIYALMNNMSIEQAKNEVDFWNEVSL